MAEEPQGQAQPQAAPHAAEAPAPVGREAFTEALGSASGLKAKDAADWLRKLMPAKKVMGVQLDGLGRLDPSSAKGWQEFTTKAEFAESRRRLAQRVAVWIDLLGQVEDTSEATDRLDERVDKLTSTLEKNQAAALEAIRPLEANYRMLDAFFANAQLEPGDKIDAWIFNANPKKLMDPDDRDNFELLAEQIQEAYRSFSMRKNFGLLVMPGWMGDVKLVDRLAELAHQNKLTVISDGPDFDDASALIEYMQDENFAGMLGNAPEKRNIALYCNYLVARSKHKVEEEDLYVPPSCHVAGSIVKGDNKHGIHQSIAGFFHGKLQNAVGARFRVDRPKATRLMTKHGLNAVVDWDGYPTVVGDQNLCNQEGKNAYSLIRTEDWIVKNVLNFLNYQAFQAINTSNLGKWKAAIYRYLDSICDRYGNNVITGFDVKVTASDEDKRKNQVNVMLKVEYQHMVRYFNLRVRDKNGRKEAEEAEE